MSAPPPPRWEILAAAGIVLAAAILRLYGLGGNPPGLFHDELEKGYTAYELIQTGRHGSLGASGVTVSAPMPLFVEVYTGHDRTSAIYQYLSAPLVGLFGLNAWTTRLVAALGGILSVAAVWLLARRLLGPAAALAAAASMAFHPTGLIFSRWAQQGILVLPMAMLGFWALLSVPDLPRRHQRALAVAGALLLGLAAYSYAPARLVVPLLAAAWAATRPRAEWRSMWKEYAWAGGVFLAVWTPLLVYTLTAGSARLDRVGLLGEGLLPGVLTAAGNYLAHFEPMFFYITGDGNARHALPGTGFVGWGSGVMILGGAAAIALAWRKRDHGKTRAGLFALLWLLAAPAASALTNEGIPHALRANLMIPATALLAGCSVWIADWLGHSKAVYTMACLLLLLDLGESAVGLARLKDAPRTPWEIGLQEALSEGLAGEGGIFLSAAVPYASYAALFAEKTPPAEFHEAGLEALETQLVPPGQTPPMGEGDVYIARPESNLPMEMFEEFVVIYEIRNGRIAVRRPPGGE